MTEPCFPNLSRQAGAILTEKVCQRICRTAEKLDMVGIVPQKELTNNRMYGSKVRTYGNYGPSDDGVSGVK